MTNVVFTILLFGHIASIVVWLGAAIALVSTVGPSLKSLNMDSQKAFRSSFLPKYSRTVIGAATGAMLFGFFLFDYLSTVATDLMPRGWSLLMIYTGAILGFVAFVVSLAVLIPAARHAATSPPSDRVPWVRVEWTTGGSMKELEGQGRTIMSGISAVIILLSLVLVLMIVGTNL